MEVKGKSVLMGKYVQDEDGNTKFYLYDHTTEKMSDSYIVIEPTQKHYYCKCANTEDYRSYGKTYCKSCGHTK